MGGWARAPRRDHSHVQAQRYVMPHPAGVYHYRAHACGNELLHMNVSQYDGGYRVVSHAQQR